MKDQYFGEMSAFRKYGLLRFRRRLAAICSAWGPKEIVASEHPPNRVDGPLALS